MQQPLQTIPTDTATFAPSAATLAAHIHRVPPERVLAAHLRADDTLIAVLDYGINGAPKHITPPEVTHRALREIQTAPKSDNSPSTTRQRTHRKTNQP